MSNDAEMGLLDIFFYLLWIPAHQGAVQDQPYQLPVEIDPLIGLSLPSLFAIH